MSDQLTAQDVVRIWKEVFPNSEANYKSILGSTAVALRLLKKDEQYNRIVENDPLYYTVWIEGDNIRESDLHVLTRPPEGSYLVYQSVNHRRQTIKNVTEDKLRKRFRKIRDWLKQQDIPQLDRVEKKLV